MRPLAPLRALALGLERRRMPAPLPDEVRLFERADALLEDRGLDAAALTPGRLEALTREHGLDLATALVHRAQRRAHAAFVAAVEAPLPDVLPQLRGRLVVVPAPHHDTLPGFGGDGALVRRAAAAFGLTSEVVLLPSYGGLEANAARVRAALEGPGPVWLASLSKGSADVRVCLERWPEAARGVEAWISLAGLVGGTPLVDGVPTWRRRLIEAVLGVPGGALGELSDRGRLGEPFLPPPGLPVVSVVGCPLEAHTTTAEARARHRRLGARGPNDGAALLPHAVVPGGPVVTVWGADHYLRVPHAARLLYGLFQALGEGGG